MSKHSQILDYVINRKRDNQDICSVGATRAADCGTKHMMLRAKLKLEVRCKVRWNGVKVSKRVNLKLKDPKVKEKLQSVFERTNFDGTWDQFKTSVCQASAEILGCVECKHLDWFDENDLSSWKSGTKHTRSTLVHLRKTEQCCCSHLKSFYYCRMKNQWWLDLSNKMQVAYNSKDSKTSNKCLNQNHRQFHHLSLKIAQS